MDINKISEKYQQIQDAACKLLEDTDGKGKFSKNCWNKDIGGGITRVLQNGRHIEKAAINFSHVSGEYTPQLEKITGKSGGRYAAVGVSSIIHPVNPHSPVIHMNIRYFETDNGICWFGGGIDLTPHYIDIDEAINFHKKLKNVCDKYNPVFYPKFKEHADDYFFLSHRNETRGVGGIFFDLLEPLTINDEHKYFSFTVALGELYPKLYCEILKKKATLPYSEAEKEWQLLRRSRYVEFNLLYDRGTKFGLETGGNTESILVSMPPEVKWEYNNSPAMNSKEMKTLQLLKKGINWVDFDADKSGIIGEGVLKKVG